ncbi:major facilitator superfamily transporter protein [Klebsiella pneumoniae]|uniref:MFS transporter n=1 Tax=Klebsiella pneumoniae TaxID=573 RepID=UPI000AF07DCF|nr:MFS transporter [Klebsiella pneumoniae]OKN29631.1 major facilitator superfamily transporter protein [Klebsiella pneumoniae]
MMGPQILSLMQVLYRPHERFRVMSIFGLLGGAAGILGPVLGGIIIESNLFGLSWRPIFLINVPVIVVAVILAWRALPAVRSPAAKGIDPLGTLLAVVAAARAAAHPDRRLRPALAAMDGAAAAAVAHHGGPPLASSAGP